MVEKPPQIDPTKNVLDLVRAETKRQDDLRGLDGHWRDKMDALRERHATEIARKESDRIDAIRAVDVGNVQRAAEVQSDQQGVLAATVAASAEALRAQVASTAVAFDAKLTLALDPIQKRIDGLSQAQYEAQGSKAQVVEQRAAVSGTTVIVTVALAFFALIVTGIGAYAALHHTGGASPAVVCTATYHPSPCP